MKKVLIITLFTLSTTFFLSSCKKCVECKAESNGGTQKGEICGNKKEREAFEKTWRDTWGANENVKCD
jgi:hypothetical protein